jgi:putative membrane protein
VDEPEQADQGANAVTARDFLANERTLLAWARTGIALIGLGFAVARFGLARFEPGVAPGVAPSTSATWSESTLVGVVLIAVGAMLTCLGTLQYVRTGRALERGQYRWSPVAGASVSAALVVVALGLMLYLLL